MLIAGQPGTGKTAIAMGESNYRNVLCRLPEQERHVEITLCSVVVVVVKVG